MLLPLSNLCASFLVRVFRHLVALHHGVISLLLFVIIVWNFTCGSCQKLSVFNNVKMCSNNDFLNMP